MEGFLPDLELFCFIMLIVFAVLIYQLSQIRQDISLLRRKAANIQQLLRNASTTDNKADSPQTVQHVKEEIVPSCIQKQQEPLSKSLPPPADKKVSSSISIEDDLDPIPPCVEPKRVISTPQASPSIWQYFQPKLKQAASFLWQRSKQWLTQGNVPVRVGMLVLFAGIAALLKQLNAQGWLYVPIYARLMGITMLVGVYPLFSWE